MAKQKLNVLHLGYAIGIICAIYVLFLGFAAWLFNWGTPLLNTIATLYKGFAPTFTGSIIGAVWGFVDGFIAGVVIAALYNKFKK